MQFMVYSNFLKALTSSKAGQKRCDTYFQEQQILHLDPHVQSGRSGRSLHQANTISTLQEHKHQERRIFIYHCDPTKENSAGTQQSLNYLLNGFLFHVHLSPSQTPNKHRTFFRRKTIQVSLLKIKAVLLRVSPLQAGEQRKMKSPVSNLA